jgi:Rieske Fe-S protein
LTTPDATPTGQQLTIDRRGALSAACLLAVTAAVAGCAARDEKSASAPGTVIGSPEDVPVGGGTVFGDHKVVVTQPVQGTFAAFSATCTHQGCTVGEVTEGVITCPCHGSRFAVADGAVVRGPADAPLPPVAIAVDGTRIRLV